MTSLLQLMYMIQTGTNDRLILFFIPGPDTTGAIALSMLFRIPG